MDTTEALRKYIGTRDRRVARHSWNKEAISGLWSDLLRFGSIRVGGRATSGAGNLDASWVEFTAWNEVVTKAQKLGYLITIANTFPSTGAGSGGYWSENEYTLTREEG